MVCIQVDIPQPAPKQFQKQSVGVDVGIKALATLSEGSSRWWEAKRKLERFHYRIANQRADAHHKASHATAFTYALIDVEELHVKGMVKNRRLALAVSDVGLGKFIRQTEYKAEAFGVTVVKVGRFFASSKSCSDCGYINGQPTLADRKWTCVGCGVIHPRDWSAAINIEQEALWIGV